MVKTLSAKAEDKEMQVRSLGWENPLEKGHGNPLQHSCLENPMDRGSSWATVHGVTKSWIRLKRLSTHTEGSDIANFL